MQLNINGTPRDVAAPLTVSALLQQLELIPERVVVELNREILTTDTHAATQLKNGDTLELIQFVGGG